MSLKRQGSAIFRILLLLFFIFILNACSPAKPVKKAVQKKTPTTYHSTIFDLKDASPASSTRLADARPNIIVILTDDQPPSTLAYLPTIKNELMAKGVVFQDGFVTTPLCCPSRASILCGQYAHNHGVLTDKYPLGGAVKFNDKNTVSTAMKSLGYQTAYVGKYLNEYSNLKPSGVVPPGWDEWDVLLGRNNPDFNFYYDFSMSENGQVVNYTKSQANYSTDVITKKAVDYIGRQKDAPFFLFLGYFGPHSPYIAASRHKDEFRTGSQFDFTPNRPPNFNEADVSKKPSYIQESIIPTSPETLDAANKQILRALLSVDDGVASILNALHKTGLSQNTVILFLSDNGLTIGEHRFGIDKNCPYDECSHIPYIVYAPGNFTPRIDSVHIVANIDVMPTLIDLAGGKATGKIDGQSLLPLLENMDTSWRKSLLLEHWPDTGEDSLGVGAMIPQFSAIRTNEWKYVEYLTGEKELYDLTSDPYELNNLASLSAHSAVQADLANQLQDLKSK